MMDILVVLVVVLLLIGFSDEISILKSNKKNGKEDMNTMNGGDFALMDLVKQMQEDIEILHRKVDDLQNHKQRSTWAAISKLCFLKSGVCPDGFTQHRVMFKLIANDDNVYSEEATISGHFGDSQVLDKRPNDKELMVDLHSCCRQ